jgi:hypothetical protein
VNPTANASLATAHDAGPATEQQVAKDIIRRGILVLPVALGIGGLFWGVDGVLSVGYAAVLVLVNFWVNAALLSWASRISYAMVMGVALFGFAIRLALVSAAVMAVADQDWVRPVPLGVTLVVSHLGLLFWETRYVSASLAFPGLKPAPEE